MEVTGSISSPKEPRKSATFSRREKKTRKNSDMDNAGQESLVVISRAKYQERHKRCRRSKKSNAKKKSMKEEDTNNSTNSEEDEKVEVEKKIVALQKIVPGGESLGADKLFEETAGYILELQCQVKALKFLASFVEGSHKEKRKFGG